MAGASQSHFLQALGWATLNSFWQMALLWCGFVAVGYLLKHSSHRKYQLATITLLIGFCWFLLTFFRFLDAGSTSLTILDAHVSASNNVFQVCLLSASYAYLLLLLLPAWQLYRNFRYVRIIKSQGLQKPDVQYRLFVQNKAAHLGISRKVQVFVSELVSSPVTVGFVKPLILLPVAALNNLSVAQTEAILLHELSHIRRYDYLINLIISFIHTALYYNPFVKSLIRVIEAERENCCDELVLNHEYDRLSYAGALLTLEKMNSHTTLLALEAAGKKHIVRRIEKIVGIPASKKFRLNQFAGLLAAITCVVLFNSVLILQDQRSPLPVSTPALAGVGNPFFLDNDAGPREIVPQQPAPARRSYLAVAPGSGTKAEKAADVKIIPVTSPAGAPSINTPTDVQKVQLLNVNFDDVDGSLTQEEKQHVQKTVGSMKKILRSNWQLVEDSIADVMDAREKEMAKIEYLNKVKELNWIAIEKNLKAEYNRLNWQHIDKSLYGALSLIQLDSLQRSYQEMEVALQKARTEAQSHTEITDSPLPDNSLKAIEEAQTRLNKYINIINAMKNRKVVHL